MERKVIRDCFTTCFFRDEIFLYFASATKITLIGSKETSPFQTKRLVFSLIDFCFPLYLVPSSL